MIKVVFDPLSLDAQSKQWWEDWHKRAEAATDEAIYAFESWLEQRPTGAFKFTFDDAIWKALKDWIRDKLFFGKCAYCESQIIRNPTHAEHYRPKGAVKRKTASGVLKTAVCEMMDPVAVTIPHPGYFWLAYDWRNLVPSCYDCNTGMGKKERFDIKSEYKILIGLGPAEIDAFPDYAKPRQSKKWPGYYYLSPVGLDQLEQPFLLNPLNPTEERYPQKHIRFGVGGLIMAVDNSEIGSMTIDTLKLNDENLRIARQAAQETCADKYYDRMRNVDRSDVKALLNEYRQGRYPYSAAALDYLKIRRREENSIFSLDGE